MKLHTSVFLVLSSTAFFALMGCGAASNKANPVAPGGGTDSPGAQIPSYTMAVANDDQLPACAAANDKQLVYVKSTGVFKSCEAGNWLSIDIKGKDGLTVTSNQLLNPYTTNLCTRYSAIESCFFSGGQMVKYSDGSVLLTGSYAYDMFISIDDGEWDRMTTSLTMLVPPNAPTFWQRLDWSVAREGADGRALYMVYDRALDRVGLVYDSNDNAQPDLSDEVLHIVERSAI